ncbi:MAG: 1-acyl-sn-glycerol-3-phosphate acyltransferase [Gammaproteobacteria bacterium]|nr:1-acyl-sn-glycerol-3-phosphate acyltransferase [Gammaproteobacteria bacterium]
MNWVTRSMQAAWGVWAWLSFAFAVLSSLIVVLIVPAADIRQKFVTWAARMVFVLPAFDVRVTGMDNLPTDNCVVVANHASYLDGVLLKGYLPWRFNFVIKGEMRNFGPAHFLLRRSGSKFVERTDTQGSARDARQIVKAAVSGESLGFFPEGTFQKEPGVLRFRPGAFVAATRGAMPVVPIAIHGSRYVLPSRRLLPRRGPLHIDILPAIAPGDPDFETSKGLAEAARQRIIAAVGEPDLMA